MTNIVLNEYEDCKMRSTKYDGIKGTLRGLAGLIEVLLLSVVYYYVWKFAYLDVL